MWAASLRQGITTETQGVSDMAAKIGSRPARRAHHGDVRNAILEVGLPHGFKPEIPVKLLEVALGRQANILTRPGPVQGIRTLRISSFPRPVPRACEAVTTRPMLTSSA